MRFVFSAHLGVSQKPPSAVLRNSRARPIESGDFAAHLRSLIRRDGRIKNKSAHIGADRIQVSLLFALLVLQEQLRNRSSRPLRMLHRDIVAARSFLRSSRP